MSSYANCRTMSFREDLRSSFRVFEEQHTKQKELERSEYSEIDRILQKKFEELFGDEDE